MSKNKKNMSGLTAVQIRKNKLNSSQDIKYKCLECGVEEYIPKSVVEMFDELDDEGDLSVPPRFNCEKCTGQMSPVEYIGVHGITYKI